MPYRIEGQEDYLTASLGATLMPQDGESFETLVSNADLALSQGKVGGRFQVRFFERSVRGKGRMTGMPWNNLSTGLSRITNSLSSTSRSSI